MGEQRHNVDKLNKIFKRFEVPYLIKERKSKVYLVDQEQGEETRLKTDYQNGTINDDGLIQISEIIEKNKKRVEKAPLDWKRPQDVYSTLTQQENIYGRTLEKTVTTSIVITSVLLITLSSFKLTGNAIAESTEITNKAMFTLLAVLITSFIVYLRNKKKSESCDYF